MYRDPRQVDDRSARVNLLGGARPEASGMHASAHPDYGLGGQAYEAPVSPRNLSGAQSAPPYSPPHHRPSLERDPEHPLASSANLGRADQPHSPTSTVVDNPVHQSNIKPLRIVPPGGSTTVTPDGSIDGSRPSSPRGIALKANQTQLFPRLNATAESAFVFLISIGVGTFAGFCYGDMGEDGERGLPNKTQGDLFNRRNDLLWSIALNVLTYIIITRDVLRPQFWQFYSSLFSKMKTLPLGLSIILIDLLSASPLYTTMVTSEAYLKESTHSEMSHIKAYGMWVIRAFGLLLATTTLPAKARELVQEWKDALKETDQIPNLESLPGEHPVDFKRRQDALMYSKAYRVTRVAIKSILLSIAPALVYSFLQHSLIFKSLSVGMFGETIAKAISQAVTEHTNWMRAADIGIAAIGLLPFNYYWINKGTATAFYALEALSKSTAYLAYAATNACSPKQVIGERIFNAFTQKTHQAPIKLSSFSAAVAGGLLLITSSLYGLAGYAGWSSGAPAGALGPQASNTTTTAFDFEDGTAPVMWGIGWIFNTAAAVGFCYLTVKSIPSMSQAFQKTVEKMNPQRTGETFSKPACCFKGNPLGDDTAKAFAQPANEPSPA